MNLKEKLHSETARIDWAELQPHFARGVLFHVDSSLDLIDIAVKFAENRADQLELKLTKELIAAPTTQQAKDWYKANTEFWAVVVAPFVLVQEVSV